MIIKSNNNDKKTHINMNNSVFRNINQTNKQTGTINFHGHTPNIPYSLHKMPRTLKLFFLLWNESYQFVI